MSLVRTAFNLLVILLLASCSCREDKTQKNKVIIIQPFNDFSPTLTHLIFNKIKAINPNTILRKPIPLPRMAYYLPRNRYRADSMIRYLSRMTTGDTTFIGLTNKDISITNGKVVDWGVMGFAYRPGRASVVSTFRLAKKNISTQFYKVAIHELGHTQGLPHCDNITCFMRDAKGGNHLDEENNFCASCTSILKKKGWQLN